MFENKKVFRNVLTTLVNQVSENKKVFRKLYHS